MKKLGWTLGSAIVAVGLAASPAAAVPDKAPDGKPIFTKFQCSSCHAIASQGIVKKAGPTKAPEEPDAVKKAPPDLSGVGAKRNAVWIAAFLSKKEAIEGRKHMKKFRGTDAELATLAAWLETLKDEKAAKGAPTK